MGVTWAVGWLGTLAIAEVAMSGFGGPLVGNLVIFAGSGFVAGTAFSVALGIAGGRRRFDEMSLPRFAAWGAVGGLVTMGVLMAIYPGGALLTYMVVGSVVTLLGAGSAAGSLALARRAEDRELLEAGEEALGLTEGEPAR